MWFKNLRIYRLTKSFDFSTETLEAALAQHSYTPCGSMDFSQYGWIPPLRQHSELYTHGCNGYIMICARKQEKILPPAAIKEMVDEKVLELQARQMRNVYRKEQRNIKEDVIVSLLPRALTRSSVIYAYFAPKQNFLIIDTASANKAEEFMDHLRQALGSLPVVPLSCHSDAAEVMTRWVQHQPPAGFELDSECELRNPRASANIIRCKNQELESDEVLGHIKAGKRVIQLAISWQQALRFILTEDFAIKRLRFEDIVQDQAASEEDDFAAQFDQDFAIMSLQLSQFLDELLQAFSGIGKA